MRQTGACGVVRGMGCWQVFRTAHAGFVLDALEQAHDRSRVQGGDWFDNRRLFEPISKEPPARAKDLYHLLQEVAALVLYLNPSSLPQTPHGTARH